MNVTLAPTSTSIRARISATLNRRAREYASTIAIAITSVGAMTASASTEKLTVSVTATDIVLTWPSEAEKTYTVQHVRNLDGESFSRRNLAAHIVATPPQNTFTTPIPADQGFYRLLTEPDVPTLPATHYNYAHITLPDHFLNNGFPEDLIYQSAAIDNDNTPANNPTTDAGATLGRVLFYDKKLSANGTQSCASCHNQSHGFADPDILSAGFDGGHTRRHSTGLANARFFKDGTFFWDTRATTLEDQVLMPFQDSVEMGLTLEQLVSIVDAQSYYPSLFTTAFGDSEVTTDRISKALAQFIRSMVSATAKYDEGRAQVNSALQNFPNFTDQENEGKTLFLLPGTRQMNCGGCHVSEAFINIDLSSLVPQSITSAQNNGLDTASTTDLGVQEVTRRTIDTGKFKVPSLRNIAIRPPYMHDGRFETLEEVLDHYSTGINDHPQLAESLVDNDTGEPVRFNFTESEKAALIAFLNTLTDEPFLTDPKYSDPFN